MAVSELLSTTELADLKLGVRAGGDCLGHRISHPRVQKPGLAFAGYYDYIKPGRVQIVGESEIAYLETISPSVRRERFEHIVERPIPVLVVTKGLSVFPELIELCERHRIPVLVSPAMTSVIIKRLSFYLEDHLVPVTHLHGVLVGLWGIGVLLIGKSGVGKSESALDLITRGHSLVADDRVTIRRYSNGDLIGYCDTPARFHMELRGLGIVNVKDLFGLGAVRERVRVDLVIELEHWEEGKAYDRLGLDETVFTILDSPVPYIRMPVATGRNLAILVEIAARNHVLKMQGHDSAREFVLQLEAELARKKEKST